MGLVSISGFKSLRQVCGKPWRDAVISTVNDNYAGVYHGVREGYSGSYVPFGEGSREEDLNEGDIYDYLDETIGTQLSGGRHVKYADTGTAMEFAIDSLQVTLRNAPLAPSDPAHAPAV